MLFNKFCRHSKVLGITLSFTLLLLTLPATSTETSTPPPEGNAPIGAIVDLDHGHKAGDIMFSYRGMVIGLQALQSGTDILETSDVLKDYDLAPEYMITSTQMHSASYVPHDHITLMAIINYHDRIMLMDSSYQQRRIDSGGLGDVKFDAMLTLLTKDHFTLTGNIGISLPTGSITETGDDGRLLPYPMQLGSGSYEARPGVTFFGTKKDWSYGSQLLSSLPLHQNARKYRHGNIITMTAWSTQRVNTWFRFGGRLLFSHKAAFSSSNPELNQNESPIHQIDSQGSTQLDIAISTDFMIPSQVSFLRNRLAFEIQMPVYQNLKGIQLINRLQFTAGCQFVFR